MNTTRLVRFFGRFVQALAVTLYLTALMLFIDRDIDKNTMIVTTACSVVGYGLASTVRYLYRDKTSSKTPETAS